MRHITADKILINRPIDKVYPQQQRVRNPPCVRNDPKTRQESCGWPNILINDSHVCAHYLFFVLLLIPRNFNEILLGCCMRAAYTSYVTRVHAHAYAQAYAHNFSVLRTHNSIIEYVYTCVCEYASQYLELCLYAIGTESQRGVYFITPHLRNTQSQQLRIAVDLIESSQNGRSYI